MFGELNKAYANVPKGLLFTNWIFQRILKINSDVPYSVCYTSVIQGFHNIKIIGDPETIKISMAVSGGCYLGITDGSNLEIGEGTIWAFNVCIQTSNHDPFNRNQQVLKSVKIGRNCWLGNSVTILAGVELGDNVTVGANSVVTKNFPPNVVIAGCPAKIIKTLPSHE